MRRDANSIFIVRKIVASTTSFFILDYSFLLIQTTASSFQNYLLDIYNKLK